MKKAIISIVAAFAAITMSAQTVNVHFKNGQTIQFPSGNVDYVDFSAKAPEPTVSAGAVVDLGLSVYWCSCNVGAESPEEYGDYFAWGETKTKSTYSKDTYSYYDSNTTQYVDIGRNICGTEYDAATVNLGSDWKMPTKEQVEELTKNCTWEWTQLNNINGYKVTGPNGNSIFLPSSGFKSHGVIQYQKEKKGICVWIGDKSSTSYAYYLADPLSDLEINRTPNYYGYTGHPIRPVTINPNAQGGPVDHSQDYLITNKISAAFTGGSYTTINGKISSGSQLNVKFTNGSSEAVTLVGVQLVDGSTNTAGNNGLDSEEEVPAGESKAYTVTVGVTNIAKPIIRFTYRYNKKKYTVEGTWNL